MFGSNWMNFNVAKNIKYFLVLIILFFTNIAVYGSDHGETKRSLTVADSIQMKWVIDLQSPYLPLEAKDFDFSPDGQYFYIVTRKGNIESGKNDYELVVYSVNNVLNFINDKNATQLPKGNTLIKVSTNSEKGGLRQYSIREVKWHKDSQNLFYIADDGNTSSQVFKINLETKNIEQITNHNTNVFFYDINDRMDNIVYLATIDNRDNDRLKTSYAVGVKSVFDIVNINEGSPFFFDYQLYHLDLKNENLPKAIGEVINRMRVGRRNFWLSPNGKKLIAAIPYDSNYHKEIYNRYEPIKNSAYYKKIIEKFDPNTMKPSNYLFSRFVMVDITTGKSKEILGTAPTAFNIASKDLHALWMPDNENVILGPTFLPLNESIFSDCQNNNQKPVIVSYNINSTKINCIFQMEIQNNKKRSLFRKTYLSFLSMSLKHENSIILKFQDNISGEEIYKKYEKSEENWFKKEENTQLEEDKILNLYISQNLNTPPEITAIDNATLNKKIITDLNPQFRNLTFGNVKVFQWHDVDGRNWEGGLVYPPNYTKSKKYPLVIQMGGGFNENKFLIDGSFARDSFSAQALANKNIFVLQIADINQVTKEDVRGLPDELIINRKGIESAIDKLSKYNLIDKNKVGMIGFSRTGIFVDYMVTFSNYDIAAAVITDASMLNLTNVIIHFGHHGEAMGFIEGLTGGAKPWGNTLPQWFSKISLFNLDKVKTPLRIENYLDNGRYFLTNWDHYALLKRMNKPVEMILYPSANHTTISPNVRMDSAGGAVDWFSFWLLDEEDQDPSKVERYQRWHKLRAQQKESIVNALVAREKSYTSEKKPKIDNLIIEKKVIK